jgi:hypothetical protein
MGFPAGLERTIVVDLSGKLPAGSHRIRIVTNLQIYWDQVLVDDGPNDRAPWCMRRRCRWPKLRCGSMGIRGRLRAPAPAILNYDYDEVSLTGPFQRQRGSYTRVGDVTPLLTGVDNKFAIFGSGEELAPEFDATVLAAVAAALEARLLLLCQWICEGYGLLRCFAVYGVAVAVSWDEHLSVSGE